MTCARRQAGARTPAPSTSAGSRRADPRTGRARARLSFVPVLALLAGAFSLFAPAPADAQTVWRSALVAQNFYSSYYGCGFDDPTAGCQISSNLSSNTFTFNGKQWEIGNVYVQESTGSLTLSISLKNPQSTRADADAFSRLKLRIGDFTFDLETGDNPAFRLDLKSSLVVPQTSITYGRSGNEQHEQALLNVLKAGGTLGIELFGLEASNPPAAPTNPRVESRSDDQLGFAWSSPSGVVAGYDVHYTSLSAGYAPDTRPALDESEFWRYRPGNGWVALSRTGQTASQTISGLIPGTAYRVRVRARNSAGVSDWVVIEGTTSGTPPSVTVFDPAPVGDVLVSNFSQRPYALSSQPNQRAWGQAFTTGSVPTMLSSIDLVASFSAHTKQLQVELWSATSGGFPNAKISDLVVPWGNIAAGETVSFGAPANTRLAANTAYSIVLYRPGNPAAIGFATTNNNNEDPGAATGWSIADGSASYTGHSPSAGLNNSLSKSSFVIAVKGRLEPNLVTLSASPNPVQEGSPVTVTATLSRALDEDVSIPIAAASVAKEIRIRAGTTTGTYEHTAGDAPDGEMKREQMVVLNRLLKRMRPPIDLGDPYLVNVQVLDENADPARVSVSDAKGWEQLNNYGRLCFEFTLDRAVSHEVWVNYWTEDGTAKAGQDYTGKTSLSLGFAPGETRKSKCISIIDDGVEDSGETFFVVLGNPPEGAILGRDRGTGTIYNHEPTSLSGLTAEGASGEEGPFAALDIGTFAPATTAYSATVPHGTTHVRLTATSLNRYLTITTGLDGKGKTQVPFGGGTGPAVALAVGENVLVVKTLFNGQRQTYRVTVTREEAPAAVAVSLSATPNPVDEGSPVTVTATLAEALDEAVTIPLTVTRGTSENGDHGSLASITLPAGFTSAAGTVTTVEDDDGDDETFTVALGSLTTGLTAGSASSVEVTITDSGLQQPAAPLTAAFANVPSEHDGTAFTFDLTLSEAPGAGNLPVAASFKVAPGKASVSGSGTSYTVTVTPKAANAWKDVTVTLLQPADCTVAGAICTADGRALSNSASATVGGPVRIRIEGARAKEGKDESLDFAVTLNRAASHEVSVDYATEDGTAAAGADYTATSGTLTFAAGEMAKTVSVPVLDDAIDEGKEVMRLLLSNPQGAFLRGVHSKAKGVIRNDDPLQAMWLSRFGRMVAADAVASVTARLETPRDAGSHLTLAGQRVNLSSAGDDGAGLAETLTGLARAFGAREAPAPDGDDGLFAHDGRTGAWNAAAATSPRSLTGRDLLLGTSFRAVLGQGAGSQWTSWGQGASVSRFSAAVPGLDLSGESATGSMGMDYERGRLLLGLAMTHSVGDGTAEDAEWRYALGSTATMAMPYARLAFSERISAWGLAGTGSGRLSLDLDGGVAQRYRTDLAMRLAAVGVHGDLVTPAEAGGFALALKADAFWVRTESDRILATAFGSLMSARGESSRVRAVLDGSRTFHLASGATLAPSLELGLRHDGGDAETGSGVEFGAGLGYADPSRGLDMALKVHGLAVHAADGYDEWGVTGQFRLAPGAAGRGLTASLTPSWGVDTSGSERLWAEPASAGLTAATGGAAPSSRLDGEVGYGMAVFENRFTGTPHVGFGFSEAAREVRMGWRLAPAAGSGPALSFDAVRREAANDAAAEHGVMLRSAVRW